MDPIIGGALIGGGAAVIGGYLNQEAQKDANEINKRMSEQNMAQQREFAQHGIRWKVEDAKKAGIHPLAALGAQTHSPSSSYIGASPVSMGDSISNMGQDISRAMLAKATPEEKQLANIQLSSAKLDLEGKAIDNQIRASQLRKLQANPPGLPSAMGQPIPGQGDGAYNVTPSVITASDGQDLAKEAGMLNDYTIARTSTGLVPVPSKDMKERIEDSVFLELPWAMRHFVTGNKHPTIPEGYDWNPVSMQYEKDYHKTWHGRPFKNYWKDFKDHNFKRSRNTSLRLTK